MQANVLETPPSAVPVVELEDPWSSLTWLKGSRGNVMRALWLEGTQLQQVDEFQHDVRVAWLAFFDERIAELEAARA